MLARFTRLPLRRCLHTQAARPRISKFTPVFLGVSAVTVTYITWRSLSVPIALDSHVTSSRMFQSTNLHPPYTSHHLNFLPPSALQKPTVSSKPSSKATVTSSSSGSIPETSLPDPELSSERSATPPTPQEEEKETGNSPGDTSEQHGEGEEDSKPASGGAFNPETGEINWDCPCLGGMAHGPCGPEFREAFSCFVFSEQEPKGIDCVEKFKAMQDCFRKHPEVYRDEIDDDEEATVAAGAPEVPPVPVSTEEGASSPTETPSIPQDTPTISTEPNTSS